MKGLLLICMSLITLSAQAENTEYPSEIIGLKMHSGEIISNLSLHESSKVLESLETSSNIEIREKIIYPEEVSQVLRRDLTNLPIIAKRPNQSDYL